MHRNSRGLGLALLVCLFLGSVAWIYLGDILSLAADSGGSLPRSFSYPFPSQFMPVVVDIPLPTPTSSPPPPLPTLYVGLQMRWEGEGYLYLDGYYWNPGTHLQRMVDRQVDTDTVRIVANHWYSPNPFGWPDENWYCHYNTLTNYAEVCSTQSDPAWKWGDYWILPAALTLESGKTVTIDGQVFNVTGPHSFLTGYGEQAYFWRLINRDRFLIYHNGDEWKQFVEKDDAILFYEFTKSRTRLYSNIKRTYYKNDKQTGDNVRYEEYMTQFSGLLDVAGELRQNGPIEEAPPAIYLSEVQMTALLDKLGIDSASIKTHH